jgi:hypothetical protein
MNRWGHLFVIHSPAGVYHGILMNVRHIKLFFKSALSFPETI